MKFKTIPRAEAYFTDLSLLLCEKHAEPFSGEEKYRHPDPNSKLHCASYLCPKPWKYQVNISKYEEEKS